MSSKYSSRISWPVSRALGGDELIDMAAEVAQHEVLIGCRLAVVDLLGPLLERQLDAKRLVDGKGDIEKVQTVDLQIVYGVALGLNGLARNIACLGNNIRDLVECDSHATTLPGYSA